MANLEIATRQIETKTRDLNKIATPNISYQQKQPPQQQLNSKHQSQKQSMAAVAGNDMTTTTEPLGWITVSKTANTSPGRK